MNVDFLSSIHQVTAADWDTLCPDDYPFVRHAFLAALEDSGSLGIEQGWMPHHLILRDQDRLQLAMPLYIKTHSYGEYVFDWRWAQAYAAHRLDYYPKLVNAVPFSPCHGPRWLGGLTPALAARVVAALSEECQRLRASGWHCLFPEAALKDQLQQLGASVRLGCQFHWFNRGYRDFDDFLARLNARKRKMIRRERAEVQGFDFDWRSGRELAPADWDTFYNLYQHTYLKRSGHQGYLTRDFFQRLGQSLPDNTLMIRAQRQGQTLAAALFLQDSRRLYGRYWGCTADVDFLHFETCYYQGIDYVLARGLERFDGGAQGEHKLARGFEPLATWSCHWLAHPDFHRAAAAFSQSEADAVEDYLVEAREYLPFRREA